MYSKSESLRPRHKRYLKPVQSYRTMYMYVLKKRLHALYTSTTNPTKTLDVPLPHHASVRFKDT